MRVVTGLHVLQIGLKLWSTNDAYIEPALKLYQQGLFDYVELFAVPGSIGKFLGCWQGLPWPYLLHAPHSACGLNPAAAQSYPENLERVYEVETFFTALNPRHVIFHPGLNGTAREAIRQFLLFKEAAPGLFERALVENKPKTGIHGERCIGALPAELGMIARHTGLGVCLDFGHSFACAADEQLPYTNIVAQLLELSPKVFHLSDGHIASVHDEHLNLGQGDYDIGWIVSQIPDAAWVTLETKKNFRDSLDDFVEDVRYLGLGRNTEDVSRRAPFNAAHAQERLRRRNRERLARLREKLVVARRDFNAITAMIIERYKPATVWQWGSLLDERTFNERSDIDIGLVGIGEQYAAACNDAEKMTDFPLHIVDMDALEKNFLELIQLTGRRIYDRDQ